MEPPYTPNPAPPPMADPQFSTPPGGTTGYAKADLGKRFLALLIDGVIAGVLVGVFSILGVRLSGLGFLVGAAYILVRDGLAYDFADGRSVGKKVMKLRPVRLDGGAMDMESSVRRNWTLSLTYLAQGLSYLIFGYAGFFLFTGLVYLAGLVNLAEGILVITDKDGRRIGDKTGNTQVIDAGA